MTKRKLMGTRARSSAFLAMVALTAGCTRPAPPPPTAMQAMPVKVAPVVMEPVAKTDTYVATIKSRRSATIQPQVDGNLIRINVHSGDHVERGHRTADRRSRIEKFGGREAGLRFDFFIEGRAHERWNRRVIFQQAENEPELVAKMSHVDRDDQNTVRCAARKSGGIEAEVA